MARTLDEMIAKLPRAGQRRVEARYQELKREVQSLRELRELSGKAQADVAEALDIKQPSVSKIEKQTDMYLSTLQGYIKAIGGEMVVDVILPNNVRVHLRDFLETAPAVKRRKAAPKSPGRMRAKHTKRRPESSAR